MDNRAVDLRRRRVIRCLAIPKMNNLFVALHKWASKQDENFFSLMLSSYLAAVPLLESPDIAVRILSRLTNCRFDVTGDNVKSVGDYREETSDYDWKRPDLRIRAGNQLVYVEVKVQSRAHREQLENYRKGLDGERKKEGSVQTSLVLLTKDYARLSSDEEELVDYQCRWLDLAKWLRDDIGSAGQELPEVSRFLIEQFVEFLEVEKCTMEEVTLALVPGVRSFMNLLKMIEEAILHRRIPKRLNVNQNSYGWNLNVASRRHWIGVYYWNWPSVVQFEAHNVRRNAAEVIGFGDVEEEDDNRWSWYSELDLEEEPGLFDLSVEQQQERITRFFQDCLEAARKIEPE